MFAMLFIFFKRSLSSSNLRRSFLLLSFSMDEFSSIIFFLFSSIKDLLCMNCSCKKFSRLFAFMFSSCFFFFI